MLKGVSRIRNEALAKAFFYMNLIEGWGSGIHKINEALKEAGLKEMEITGGDIFLRFTIYRNQDYNSTNNGTVNGENGTVNGENGTVNSENGTVNSENGTVNSENGTVNGENGTVNTDLLSNKETLVIMQLHKNENITAQQLTQTTKIALRTVKRILVKLSEKGFIRRVGSDKSGHWEIIRH